MEVQILSPAPIKSRVSVLGKFLEHSKYIDFYSHHYFPYEIVWMAQSEQIHAKLK